MAGCSRCLKVFAMSPGKVWSVLRSPVLSWQGKLRLAAERFVPRRTAVGDESVASFRGDGWGASVRAAGSTARRRHLYGRFRTVEPGRNNAAVYRNETRWGSLIRGARTRPANGRQRGAYSLFVAPRDAYIAGGRAGRKVACRHCPR